MKAISRTFIAKQLNVSKIFYPIKPKGTSMLNKHDSELVDFIANSDPIVMSTLSVMMDTFTDFDTNDLRAYQSEASVVKLTDVERKEVGRKIVYLLRYFGSHDFAYAFRRVFSDEPGVSYDEVLGDVLKQAISQNKSKAVVPRICSIENKERLLCEVMLGNLIQGKSESEVAEMLENSGLDKERAKESAKQILITGGSGAGIIVLVRILGKKAVKEIVSQIIVQLISKAVGKEAAKKAAEKLLMQTAQKTVASFVSGIGWLLLAYDAISIMSPATRITVPCVTFIASMRVANRLSG